MKSKRLAVLSIALLTGFILWTIAIQHIDVQPVGPNGSRVGFAAVNTWFHDLTGVCWPLYTVTDWLGLAAIAVCLVFAGLGLAQWIRRRHLLKVDSDILLLGFYYIAVIAAYLLFEMIPINYRPVLIDGFLEASYPSSTTLLVACVMPTAVWQVCSRLRSDRVRTVLHIACAAFTVFMIVGRLISGVHWLTDIIGALLLSGVAVTAYIALASVLRKDA